MYSAHTRVRGRVGSGVVALLLVVTVRDRGTQRRSLF